MLPVFGCRTTFVVLGLIVHRSCCHMCNNMSSVSTLCLLCHIRSSVHLLCRILSSVSSFILVSHSSPCVIIYPLAVSPSVLFHRLCHRLSSDCVTFRSLYYLSSSMSYYLFCVILCRVIYSSPVFSVCHRLYYVCGTFYPLRHLLSSVSFDYLSSCTTFSSSFLIYSVVHRSR